MARYVTVASISHDPWQDYRGRRAELLDHAAHMLWRAKQMGADIVSFPEIYFHRTFEQPAPELAEPLDGPTLSRLGAEARRLGLHLVCPLYTREEGHTFNSSVLLSPAGRVLGVYHKKHPTIGEIEGGIRPGETEPVFTTDFGRVGMAICFDLNFPDLMQGLAANGAEVIFFSSAYRGGRQIEAWAYDLGVYIVSAILAELGRIVDLTGETLAVSTYEQLIARRINLERRLFHMDYNWDKMDDMWRKYGRGVTFDYVTPEACFAIGAEQDGLTIEQLIDEFKLERRADYWVRSNEARRRALEG